MTVAPADPPATDPAPADRGSTNPASTEPASAEPVTADPAPGSLLPLPLSADAAEWFAGLLEPIAALAIRRGVGLQVLVDSLKLALVRAAVTADAAAGRGALSDSRVSMMTGVHRKDLRRLRAAGAAGLGRGHSIASEVFTCWRADPRWCTRRGTPKVLPRLDAGDREPGFESLVASVTRDVHHRAVLDELVRLGLVEVIAGRGGERVRMLKSTYVPSADPRQTLAIARDNLADHAAAIAANLEGGGRRFLEQAIFSDELTAESAARFNRETSAAWAHVFATLMPRLRALHEGDTRAAAPRDHRVRLGMYSYAGPAEPVPADPYRKTDPPSDA